MAKKHCLICNKPLPIAQYANRKYCDEHSPKLHGSTERLSRTWTLTDKCIAEMDGVAGEVVAVPLWMIERGASRG